MSSAAQKEIVRKLCARTYLLLMKFPLLKYHLRFERLIYPRELSGKLIQNNSPIASSGVPT